MSLPECPSCQRTDNVTLFTRSKPIPGAPGEAPGMQWVAYRCSRCNTAHVRLEPAVPSDDE